MAIVALAVWSWQQRRRRYAADRRNMVEVAATIVGCGFGRISNERTATSRLVLTIDHQFRDAGGVEWRGSRSIPVSAAPQLVPIHVPGRVVPLWYAPTDPTGAVLGLDAPAAGDLVWGIAAGLYVVGYGFLMAFYT